MNEIKSVYILDFYKCGRFCVLKINSVREKIKKGIKNESVIM